MSRSRSLILLLVMLSACRVEPEPGERPSSAGSEDRTGHEPSPERATAGADSGGNGGSAGRNDALGRAGRGAGGTTDPPPGSCHAQPVSLDEIRDGAVLASVSIELVATATSQKFLVSESDEGRCLWGAFIGEEAAGGEPRGVLVISYGDDATGGGGCPTDTDAVPADLAPGDVARVVGRASSFAPAACGTILRAPQIIADARCPFERRGQGATPEPIVLAPELADELVRGTNAELFHGWIGGLVRLENVSALPNEAGDGVVRPYGVVALAETELEVHADLEYGDLGGAGPRDPSKRLDFPYPTRFRSITGLLYLDYCTLALGPRSRCTDLEPASRNCP